MNGVGVGVGVQFYDIVPATEPGALAGTAAATGAASGALTATGALAGTAAATGAASGALTATGALAGTAAATGAASGTLTGDTDFVDLTSIPDLEQLLIGDDGITLVSGLVSVWADQSGNGKDATQGTAGGRPTYHATNGPNGTAWVDFSNVSRTLFHELELTGPKTIIIVSRQTVNDGLGHTLYAIEEADVYTEILTDLTAAGYVNVNFKDDFTSSAAASVGYDDTLSTSASQILIHTYNGGSNTDTASYTASIDGVTKTVAASGAFALVPPKVSSIGSRTDGTTAILFAEAKISLIAVYSRVLDSIEMTNAIDWIKDYYEIT